MVVITHDSMESPILIQRQKIELDSIDCNYSGDRTYFLCPGDGCGRRCVTLYLVNDLFRCRQCLGLLYASQTKDTFGRLLWQANQIRQELGGEPGTSQLIASRPPGMWKSTYRRKRGVWRNIFEALARQQSDAFVFIDSSIVRTHRAAAGSKKGNWQKVLAAHAAVADKAYGSRKIRGQIADEGALAVIPSKGNERQPILHDTNLYAQRNIVERFFCTMKDMQRLAA